MAKPHTNFKRDKMQIRFNKVSVLPSTLEKDSFYYVENGTYAESYLTDSNGVAKSVGNSAMINALIAAALADWETAEDSVQIVPDIAARDALAAAADRNLMILVVDATGDPTVGAGSALYAYDFTTTTMYKIAEYESMDVTLNWVDIVGRPTSTPAQIDSAVAQSHAHTNKAVLDQFSENAQQQPLFRGQPIKSQWDTLNW